MIRKLLWVLFFILIFNTNVWAADVVKIGIVDFKQILDNSITGKSIQKQIKDKGELLKSELEELQAELKQLQDKFKQEALLWTKDRKDEEERFFRIKINDFNKQKIENERKFNEFRTRLINEAKENVLEYTKKKAQKEGYLLIIEKQTGSILYADSSTNITDELIQDINKSTTEK